MRRLEWIKWLCSTPPYSCGERLCEAYVWLIREDSIFHEGIFVIFAVKIFSHSLSRYDHSTHITSKHMQRISRRDQNECNVTGTVSGTNSKWHVFTSLSPSSELELVAALWKT